MEIVTVVSYLAGKKHDFKACDELMTYAVWLNGLSDACLMYV